MVGVPETYCPCIMFQGLLPLHYVSTDYRSSRTVSYDSRQIETHSPNGRLAREGGLQVWIGEEAQIKETAGHNQHR
jgi:hypothetical protein